MANKNDFQSGAQLVVVDATEFQTKMRDLFREVVDEFQAERDEAEKARAKEPENFYWLLSVSDVCERLHVCKATLWRWNKNGLLPVLKIGSKAYYRLSDVEKLEKGGNAQ